jgi:predicted outer membrane repeat protein
MEIPSLLPIPFAALSRTALLLFAVLFSTGPAGADVVLSGGGLTLVEEGGVIAPGNLAATGTAFAKDLLDLDNSPHTISGLNDQQFGNSSSWIGETSGTFAGISLGATPTSVSSIAFGRDNNVGFSDRTLGVYTLQYTTVPNPDASTTSWTDIGELNYQSAGGTNFAFPSKRHRYTFNAVAATGIRLLVPAGGLGTGTCIDELEAYSGIVVTTAADENDAIAADGNGISLREAVRDCPPGAGIGFALALSGQTIALTSGSEIVIAKNLTIDASSLPDGVTIEGGPGTNRIFSVNPNQTITLKHLTLTGGNGSGATAFGYGGAILNRGTLTLTQCTFSGNTAPLDSGAIDNTGTLTLTQCTLSGNSGTNGGAIRNFGNLMMTQCTLFGNSAIIGGAIYNRGSLTLMQGTLSGNNATLSGGAIYYDGTLTLSLTLTNSIVAGNTAPTGPDIYNFGPASINRSGVNLLGKNGSVTIQFPSGSPNAFGDYVGTDSTPLASFLAPLGNYGGPTRTMPPLAASPAIDAASGSLFTTDQRGFPIAGLPDIGAAEGVTVVTTGADEIDSPATSGTGISLREAVRDTPPGGTIGFAPALSGGTCTLNGEIFLASNVTIDASSLPAGVTIDGAPGGSRIFYIPAGQTITLKRLTLTGGNGSGAIDPGSGGAIENQGTLALMQCTLFGNNATDGGAIDSDLGVLTLTQCTLSNNFATFGGAIYNSRGPLTLTHCTLSGNNATNSGGAILNTSIPLTLVNSIVAGNTAFNVDNIFGANNQDVASLTTGDPLLAPLGNYGGPTQTMALLPGSSARNTAAVLSPAITTDQRDFPIVDTPDLGAYEAGTINSFDTWAWETMGSLLDFNADGENDSASNGLEYATRRDPMLADPSLAPEFLFNGGGHGFRFRYQKDATDLRYIVQRSTDLGATGAWQEIYRLDTRTGVTTENGVTGAENPATGLIDITDSTASPSSFWRLLIERTP